MVEVTEAIIRDEYIKELESRNGTDYFFGDTINPPEVADKMLNAIREGGRSDWLRYNNALKMACKRVGIKTSKELREIIIPQ